MTQGEIIFETALPCPNSDNTEVLYALIKHRSLTSVELKQDHTKSSYPSARIFDLQKAGLRINSIPEKYINRRGKKTHISRYNLESPIDQAKKIYLKMIGDGKN